MMYKFNIDKVKNIDIRDNIEIIMKKYEKVLNILNDSSLNLDEKDKKLKLLYRDSFETLQYRYIRSNQDIMNKFNIYEKKLRLAFSEFEEKKKNTCKKREIIYLFNFIQKYDEETKLTFDFTHLSFLILCDIISDSLKDPLKIYKIKKSELQKKVLFSLKKEYFNSGYPVDKEKIYILDVKEDKRFLDLISISVDIFEEAGLITTVKELDDTSFQTDNYVKTAFIMFDERLIKDVLKYSLKSKNLPSIIYKNDVEVKCNKFPSTLTYTIVNNKNYTLDEHVIRYNANKTPTTYLCKSIVNVLINISKQSFKINQVALEELIKNYDNVISSTLKNNIINNINFDYYLKTSSSGNISDYNKKKLKNTYQIEVQKACDIFETIYIAYVFKNNELWFSSFMDSRGRMYYQGYLLQPQGTKIARALLTFSENQSNPLISLDAIASGIQIIGLLFKNKNLLKYTYILENKDKDVDFYEYIRCKYNKDLSTQVNLITNDFSDKEKEIINKGNEKTIGNPIIYDRKVVKFFCIRIIYGQGRKSSTKELMSKFGYPYLLARFITRRFYKVLFANEPCIKLYLNITRRIALIAAEANKPAILFEASTKDYCVSQYYVQQEIVKYYFTNLKNRKNTINFSIDIFPYTADAKKMKKSLPANFVHSVDSVIMYLVLKKCMEKNIPVYPIHDCFVIQEKDLPTVEQIYKEVFLLMLNQNLLERLVHKNIKDKEVYNNILKKINKITKKSELTPADVKEIVSSKTKPLKNEGCFLKNIQEKIINFIS